MNNGNRKTKNRLGLTITAASNQPATTSPTSHASVDTSTNNTSVSSSNTTLNTSTPNSTLNSSSISNNNTSHINNKSTSINDSVAKTPTSSFTPQKISERIITSVSVQIIKFLNFFFLLILIFHQIEMQTNPRQKS